MRAPEGECCVAGKLVSLLYRSGSNRRDLACLSSESWHRCSSRTQCSALSCARGYPAGGCRGGPGSCPLRAEMPARAADRSRRTRTATASPSESLSTAGLIDGLGDLPHRLDAAWVDLLRLLRGDGIPALASPKAGPCRERTGSRSSLRGLGELGALLIDALPESIPWPRRHFAGRAGREVGAWPRAPAPVPPRGRTSPWPWVGLAQAPAGAAPRSCRVRGGPAGAVVPGQAASALGGLLVKGADPALRGGGCWPVLG